MEAKYLIRLDDACETMNIKNWERVEAILINHEIRPLVAVIPDCKDESLNFGERLRDFWDIVKRWESKGWTIGMHGYQHVYTELKDKNKSLVPIHNRTEFAGLPYEVQIEKIKRSWDLFLKNGVKPKVWIAPSHTFDLDTLKALKEATEINIVSDCFAFYPFRYADFFFIPQQIWSFIRFPFGLWTICLHPNTMTERDFSNLETWFMRYKENFISLSQIELKERTWGFFERYINHSFWFDKKKIRWLKVFKKLIK